MMSIRPHLKLSPKASTALLSSICDNSIGPCSPLSRLQVVIGALYVVNCLSINDPHVIPNKGMRLDVRGKY